MNLGSALSRSENKPVSNLMGLALNVYVAFVKIPTFTVLFLAIHEHEISFLLKISSLGSLFRFQDHVI